MPFIPTNYASIEPIGLPALRNAVQSISQGMQLRALPGHLQRQAKSEELSNLLNSINAQYLPQSLQSEIALRRANMAKAQQEAGQKQLISNLLRQALQGAGGAQGSSSLIGAVLQNNDGEQGANMSAGGPASGSSILPPDMASQILRKLMGIAPETPQEKMMHEMQMFQQKERFKEGLKDPETGRFKSSQQAAAVAIEDVLPVIDELINTSHEIPLQNKEGESYYPVSYLGALPTETGKRQAAYKSRIATSKDKIIKGLNLPSTDKTNQSIEDMISRKYGESEEAYKNKLQRFKNQLITEYSNLKPGKKFMLNEKILNSIKSVNETVRMQAPNGKIYNVPSEKVESYLKIGGKRV